MLGLFILFLIGSVCLLLLLCLWRITKYKFVWTIECWIARQRKIIFLCHLLIKYWVTLQAINYIPFWMDLVAIIKSKYIQQTNQRQRLTQNGKCLHRKWWFCFLQCTCYILEGYDCNISSIFIEMGGNLLRLFSHFRKKRGYD